MTKIHIDFQDGFANDLVVVRCDGKEILRKPDLTTRLQIGRAHSLELEVEEKLLEIRFDYPARYISKVIQVDASAPIYLGVSITPQRDLAVEISRQPFHYL